MYNFNLYGNVVAFPCRLVVVVVVVVVGFWLLVYLLFLWRPRFFVSVACPSSPSFPSSPSSPSFAPRNKWLACSAPSNSPCSIEEMFMLSMVPDTLPLTNAATNLNVTFLRRRLSRETSNTFRAFSVKCPRVLAASASSKAVFMAAQSFNERDECKR